MFLAFLLFVFLSPIWGLKVEVNSDAYNGRDAVEIEVTNIPDGASVTLILSHPQPDQDHGCNPEYEKVTFSNNVGLYEQDFDYQGGTLQTSFTVPNAYYNEPKYIIFARTRTNLDGNVDCFGNSWVVSNQFALGHNPNLPSFSDPFNSANENNLEIVAGETIVVEGTLIDWNDVEYIVLILEVSSNNFGRSQCKNNQQNTHFNQYPCNWIQSDLRAKEYGGDSTATPWLWYAEDANPAAPVSFTHEWTLPDYSAVAYRGEEFIYAVINSNAIRQNHVLDHDLTDAGLSFRIHGVVLTEAGTKTCLQDTDGNSACDLGTECTYVPYNMTLWEDFDGSDVCGEKSDMVDLYSSTFKILRYPTQEWFDKKDANDDGKLTLDESNLSPATYDQFDTNPKNGEITFNEMDGVDPCIESNPCVEGTCSEGANGNVVCTCRAGFDGVTCQNNIDDCLSSPCKNGGTCTDGNNAYGCECTGNALSGQAWGGKDCNTEGACNSGCQQGTDGLIEAFGIVSCGCTCDPGFMGTKCDTEIDGCVKHAEIVECENGKCVDGDADSFACTCDSGWTTNGFTVACDTNIDDCANNNCGDNGTCEDGINSFICNCDAGFSGDDCSSECDKDCGIHGTCTIDSNLNVYACFCEANWAGDDCTEECDPGCGDGGKCVLKGSSIAGCLCDDDHAGTNCEIKCDGGCEQGKCGDLRTCNCDENWIGDSCDIECKQVCDHGECRLKDDEQICLCEDGWIGDFCKTPCQKECNNGDCGIVDGAQICSCDDGWTGDDCNTECNRDCNNNGQCAIADGAQICSCDTNWAGSQCTHECVGCEHGVCTLDPSDNPYCACDGSWAGDKCDVPCVNGCANGGQCNLDGKCRCSAGWAGDSCDVVCDSDCGSDQDRGQCVLEEGNPVCSCYSKWKGANCEIPCTKDCDNGLCAIQDNNQVCSCDKTWFGDRCDIECTKECGDGECIVEAADQTSTVVMTCSCIGSFVGELCDTYCTKECEQGACVVEAGNEVCLCDAGWSGATCSIALGMCDNEPCINGICFSVLGIFTCECDIGWSGVDCARVCDCGDHGTCVDSTCECEAGWTGATCSIPSNNFCLRTPSHVMSCGFFVASLVVSSLTKTLL